MFQIYKSGPKGMKGFVLASGLWVSDPKMTKNDVFFAYFRIIKLLLEYEDTHATERYFLKLLLVVKFTFYERMVLWHEAFDVKFDKNFNFVWLFLAKIVNFGLDPIYLTPKQTPSFLLEPIFLYI